MNDQPNIRLESDSKPLPPGGPADWLRHPVRHERPPTDDRAGAGERAPSLPHAKGREHGFLANPT